MGNPISPAPDKGSSPSPSINSVIKDSWQGGTQKGSTDPNSCVDGAYNKKDIDVPIKK